MAYTGSCPIVLELMVMLCKASADQVNSHSFLWHQPHQCLEVCVLLLVLSKHTQEQMRYPQSDLLALFI